jgi:polysaccharide biosynthesis transport protein
VNRFHLDSDTNLTPDQSAASSHDTLDLRSLWFALRRRMGVMLGIIVACTGASIVLTSQMNDVYSANARVLIDPRERQIVDASIVSDVQPDSTIMDTEVELILSRDMMNKIVEKLNLSEDPEFNPRLREKNGAKPAASTGADAGEIPAAAASVPISGPVEAPGDAVTGLTLDQMLAADSLEQSVTAFREGLTFVITINAKSKDPEKAALIANTLTSIYISGQLSTKVAETVEAGEWLDDRLSVLREDVRMAESSVQEFRTSQGLVEAGGVSTIEAKIASLTSQLLILQADLVEKRSRHDEALRFSEADFDTAQRSDVISSSLLVTLRAQRSDLSREFADAATRFSVLHPEYIRAQNQLTELDESIAAERRRILSSLGSDVQVAASRVGAVDSELRKLNQQLNRNNVDMIKERELEREATASRQIYEGLLSRAEQVTQSAQLQRSDANLVSAAEPPTRPSAPNHKLNILLGVLSGLALAGLTALVFEMFEKGLSSSDDIEKYIGLPMLTTVPNAPVRRWGPKSTAGDLGKYMIDKPRSSFTEGVRTIFNTLYRTGRRDGAMTIAFTSALPGEGKTTLSYCVAKLASAQQHRVLIIDGDLQRRSLSAAIAPNAKTGLLEVFQKKATPQDAILTIDGGTLSVLPVAGSSEDLSIVITREDCEALFQSLKSQFDFIIIDCPPALPVLEARVIGSAADVLVFAVRWRRTHRKAVARSIEMLNKEGANILGLALTRADLRHQALYEDFGASHYKLYSAYYRD